MVLDCAGLVVLLYSPQYQSVKGGNKPTEMTLKKLSAQFTHSGESGFTQVAECLGV